MTLIHSTVKPGMGVGAGAPGPALGTPNGNCLIHGFPFLQHTKTCCSGRVIKPIFQESQVGLTHRAYIMCSEWIRTVCGLLCGSASHHLRPTSLPIPFSFQLSRREHYAHSHHMQRTLKRGGHLLGHI